MAYFAKICAAGLCGVLSTMAVGSAWAQGNVGAPSAPPPPPGVKVQVPGVTVQTPGVNGQAGVNVQAPGVNIHTNNGYYPRTPWFSNPTVREQLNLNDQQYNQLNQNYMQNWTKYNQERNLIDTKLPPEKRIEREGELSSAFNRTFTPGVDTVITDPGARQRFNQLHYQYQGYNAFQDPAVQKQLNLTAQQRQELNQNGIKWNQRLNTWRTDYPNNQARVNQQLNEARREERQRINTILTPEQRTVWNNMTGKPYDFHSDVYFPADTTTNTTLKPVIK